MLTQKYIITFTAIALTF